MARAVGRVAGVEAAAEPAAWARLATAAPLVATRVVATQVVATQNTPYAVLHFYFLI